MSYTTCTSLGMFNILMTKLYHVDYVAQHCTCSTGYYFNFQHDVAILPYKGIWKMIVAKKIIICKSFVINFDAVIGVAIVNLYVTIVLFLSTFILGSESISSC